MRRAERLFQIIQILRRHRRPVTAEALAAELEVSPRSVYRDIADLVGQRVPIEGAAGLGYLLREGFDLPPLMFKETELEALVLGARMVESWADRELAEAACDAIAKIEAVIPERLRGHMASTALLAPDGHMMAPLAFDLADLRRAIRSQRKVSFRYQDVLANRSERTVRPLSLAYFGPVWILAAWCELRADFRTFRLDRMREFEVMPDTFKNERGKTLHDFLKRPMTWARSSLAAKGSEQT